MVKKPGILTGGLIGGLLTLPLLALLFVGDKIAGFPFVPFTLFNNVRDNTPGDVMTSIIDAMINVITGLNLGRVDTVAKSIEQLMGVGMVLVIGIIAGAAFFAVMRRQEQRSDWIAGVVLGLVVGIPLTLISLVGNQTFTADRVTSVVWLMGLFLLWGYAHNYVYNRLAYPASMQYGASGRTVAADPIDRRQFLISVGGATAAITVIGAGIGALAGGDNEVQTVALAPSATEVPNPDLPNADAAVKPAPGTRPELTDVADHYRIDIAPVPPEIDGATWTLPFKAAATDGTVTDLIAFTLDDLYNNFEPMDQFITMGCISNRIAGDLISTVRWTGISMQTLLEAVDLPSEATHLKIMGADGFDEIVALDLINADPSIMMAYAWNGEPLPSRNGYPVRIHIPNHYGMKQPKWITEIVAIPEWEPGYWVRRGWDRDALVRATSVIDTVATNMVEDANGQQVIPIGGIAWAGDRGISKVEISIDGGEWTEAQLRDPLSYKTWVLWRYDWAFSEGSHTFEVRCYDGDGEMQITDVNPVRPSGATGIHEVRATV